MDKKTLKIQPSVPFVKIFLLLLKSQTFPWLILCPISI